MGNSAKNISRHRTLSPGDYWAKHPLLTEFLRDPLPIIRFKPNLQIFKSLYYVSTSAKFSVLPDFTIRLYVWLFPLSDHTLASSKSACDITLKHVLLIESNLRQNPAYKVHQILFCFRWYHYVARNWWVTVLMCVLKSFIIKVAKWKIIF